MGGRGGSFKAGGEKLEPRPLRYFGNQRKGKAAGLYANPFYEYNSEANHIFVTGFENLEKTGKVQNVDMSRIRAVQPHVTVNGVDKKTAGETTHSSDLPVGFKVGDNIYLLDGNHRAVSAYARGEKKVKMRVYNIKK